MASVAAAAAEYRLFNTALLQKRPIILRSLLIVPPHRKSSTTSIDCLHLYDRPDFSKTFKKKSTSGSRCGGSCDIGQPVMCHRKRHFLPRLAKILKSQLYSINAKSDISQKSALHFLCRMTFEKCRASRKVSSTDILHSRLNSKRHFENIHKSQLHRHLA